MGKLPLAFETFRNRYRSVYKAYEALGGAAHEGGAAGSKNKRSERHRRRLST